MSILWRRRLRVISFLGAYLGIYAFLTVFGRYETVAWSPRGSNLYRWGPLGFVKEVHEWRQPLLCIFLPVWEADRFLWHTPDLAESGRYPISRIACSLGGPLTPQSDTKFLFKFLFCAVGVLGGVRLVSYAQNGKTRGPD